MKVTEEMAECAKNVPLGHMKLNTERKGVEVWHDEKPCVEVRALLSAHGFRWSRHQNLWWTKDSPHPRWDGGMDPASFARFLTMSDGNITGGYLTVGMLREALAEVPPRFREGRSSEKVALNVRIEQIWREACLLGQEAGIGCTPTAMVVTGTDTGKEFDYPPVTDGVCGFANIRITPARGKLVAWLKQNDIGRKHWQKGWYVSIMEHNQSLTRKEAHGRKMADVLNENKDVLGFGSCFSESQID